MRLKRGDVVRKRRGGGTKRAEVLRVVPGFVHLKPLAASAARRRSAVATLVVPMDDTGLPSGYEVAS